MTLNLATVVEHLEQLELLSAGAPAATVQAAAGIFWIKPV
jgi:hypothetical protein